jgi:histidine triad (HIT) family protein
MPQINPKASFNTKINCAFCNIVQGKTMAYIVFEDDQSLAFLDNRPLFLGHCLLIPKKHLSTLSDLDASLIEALFLNVRIIAKAVEEAMEAEGTLVAINNKVSQRVPHLHVHIVPRRKKDGLRGFFWPRIFYRDDKHMEQVQNLIKSVVYSDKRLV